MTDLDKLKTQLKTVLDREADGHHRHGAIVDALEAENARLRVFIGNLANNPQRATQAQIREACASTLRVALGAA